MKIKHTACRSIAILTFSIFFSLGLITFAEAAPPPQAEEKSQNLYYPSCLFANTSDDLAACQEFCLESPNHWGCNAICMTDPSKCTPAYPRCTINPKAEGCPLFCLDNPTDNACSYVCAVAPQFCITEALDVAGCKSLSKEACLSESDTCAVVEGAKACTCQNDVFIGCQEGFDSIGCSEIRNQNICTITAGCKSELTEDGDTFLSCVSAETVVSANCNQQGAETCDSTPGCFAEKNSDNEFVVCIPANSESCGSYDSTQCTSGNGCESILGTQCSCPSEKEFYGCVPKNIEPVGEKKIEPIDICEIDPFAVDRFGEFKCELDPSYCAQRPGHWLCRPECLENSQACVDENGQTTVPRECLDNPASCADKVMPLCIHALDEEKCIDICIENPTHWACNWICLYQEGASCKTTFKNCELNPQEEGCPSFCGANPEHESCEYICKVTPKICETGASVNSDTTGQDDINQELKVCDVTPYADGCQNYCQLNPTSKGCPAICTLNSNSTDCAPACMGTNKGNCGKKYCQLHPEDLACEGKTEKTYCQAKPEADGCNEYCVINPEVDGCVSFCERMPEDPKCCTEVDGKCAEVITKVPGVGPAEEYTLVDFCGITNGVATKNTTLFPCKKTPDESYCDKNPTALMCEVSYDPFTKCTGSESECLGGLILEHKGLGIGQINAAVNQSDQGSRFRANDGEISLQFYLDEVKSISGQGTSGINFTDDTQNWVSHVAIRETSGSGKSETFVNPSISFNGYPYFSWNMNQHMWKGGTTPIFQKTGKYEYVLSVCDRAGNCLYSPKHYLEVVPAAVDASKSTFTSACNANQNWEEAGVAYSDGVDGCEFTINLEDKYGNKFAPGSEGRGKYSIKISDKTGTQNYSMIKRGINAFYDALRFRQGGKNSNVLATTTDTTGETVFDIVSFLPSADAVSLPVCVDKRLNILNAPSNKKLTLEFNLPAYDEFGGFLSQQRQSFTVGPEGDVNSSSLGVLFAPLLSTELAIDSPPPVKAVVKPGELETPIYFQVSTQNATTTIPENLTVEVTGLGGAVEMEDLDFKDTITYEFQGEPNSPAVKNEPTYFTLGGEGTDLNFGFSTVVKYFISPEISGTKDGVTVQYPGANFGRKFCSVDYTAELTGGVNTNLSLGRVPMRGVDIEGGFMQLTDSAKYVPMSQKDAQEAQADQGGAHDGDVKNEAFKLNAMDADRSNLRDGLRSEINTLIGGLNADHELNNDILTLKLTLDGDKVVGGVIPDHQRNYTYIKSEPSKNGLVVFDGGTLTGKHTVIIENANLLITGNIEYENEADDSWAFVLLNDAEVFMPEFEKTAESDKGFLKPGQEFYGNIYVNAGVREMVGTYFADGAFTSTLKTGTDYDTDRPSLLDDVERGKSGDFKQQLVLTGSLFTQNTIGGSKLGKAEQEDGTEVSGIVDPWGRSFDLFADRDRATKEARIFDLHFVRQFAYSDTDTVDGTVTNNSGQCSIVAGTDEKINDPEGDGGCYSNKNSFVIRLDQKVSTQTPPGFDTSFSYTAFE